VTRAPDSGQLTVIDAITGRSRAAVALNCPSADRVWSLNNRAFLINCGGVHRITWEGAIERVNELLSVDGISGDGSWVRSGNDLYEVDSGRTVRIDTDLPIVASRNGFIAGPDDGGQVYSIVLSETPSLTPFYQTDLSIVALPALSAESFDWGLDARGHLHALRPIRGRPLSLSVAGLDASQIVSSGRWLAWVSNNQLWTVNLLRGREPREPEAVQTNWWLRSTRPVAVDPNGHLAVFSLASESPSESLFGAMTLRNRELVGVYQLNGQILPPPAGR
jgi:hypothetical protein